MAPARSQVSRKARGLAGPETGGLPPASAGPRRRPRSAAATAAVMTLVLAGGCSSGIGSSPARLSARPTVSAAGGTTLDADLATGAYRSETAWHTPPGTANPQTSGGGFSRLFPRPAYQDGVAGIGATRGVPDVASDAAGRTGMTLAVSAGAGKDYFYPGAGTSAATPLWPR